MSFEARAALMRFANRGHGISAVSGCHRHVGKPVRQPRQHAVSDRRAALWECGEAA